MRKPLSTIKPGNKIDTCDVCGWDYPMYDLRRVSGKGLVCPDCKDEERKIRRKKNRQL